MTQPPRGFICRKNLRLLYGHLPFLPAVVLLALAGCGGEENTASTTGETADPPVVSAPALPESNTPTVAELREQLGVGPEAVFRKAGGEIRFVSLGGAKVEDISPLAGLPLRMLDLQQTKVSDISALKGMPLEELYLENSSVSDISPLAGMPLNKLYLNHTNVSDISPLARMEFEELNLYGTQVADVTPLQSARIGTLWLRQTLVESIAPLADVPLVSLDIQDTPVADLAPLAEMTSLRRLNIAGTAVTDVTPIAGLPLTRLILTPSRLTTGLDAVRQMQTLTELDVTFREPSRLSPADFWQRYDAGQLPEPPSTPRSSASE